MIYTKRKYRVQCFLNLPISLGNTSTDCGFIKKYGRTTLLSSLASNDGE